MMINFNLKNDLHICLGAISCVDMNTLVYMRLPCSSKNVEKRLCYADEQIFSKLKWSGTSQSAGSRIRSGGAHCVPKSLEGLSKATTQKPHRICNKKCPWQQVTDNLLRWPRIKTDWFLRPCWSSLMLAVLDNQLPGDKLRKEMTVRSRGPQSPRRGHAIWWHGPAVFDKLYC